VVNGVSAPETKSAKGGPLTKGGALWRTKRLEQKGKIELEESWPKIAGKEMRCVARQEP